MTDKTKKDNLFWIAMIAAALIIGVLGTMLFLKEDNINGEEVAKTVDTADLQPSEALSKADAEAEAEVVEVPKRKWTDKERYDAAVLAVFGKQGARITKMGDFEGTETETPKQLFVAPFGPILLTEIATTTECHACAGFIGAYYLKEQGDKFVVTGKYRDVLAEDWGQVPDGWLITSDYTQYPALYHESGGGGQGYFEQYATIVELTPKGPRKSHISIGSDNGGAVGEDDPAYYSFEGKIINIKRGSSLEVQYSGTCSDRQKYKMTNGEYKAVGPRSCGRSEEEL